MSSLNTMTNAFVRAMSPSVAAQHVEVDFNNPSAESNLIRYQSLQSVGSVGDLIAVVPADYRHVLRAPLEGVESTTAKLCSARATLAKWQANKAAGTLPVNLQQKVPQLQFSKGFKESAEARNYITTFETDWKATLTKCWTLRSLPSVMRSSSLRRRSNPKRS